MSIVRIANRFAEAILDAIPEGTERTSFLSDLRDVQASIRQSRELLQFFQSPVLSPRLKRDTITALFAERVGAYTLQVLLFLAEKEREEYVLEVIDAVFEKNREREGILLTSIHSAVELTGSQQAALNAALERMSGKRVESRYDVDTDLMGGLVVRLGDTVYDGSVRQQLKRLRDRFVSGA